MVNLTVAIAYPNLTKFEAIDFGLRGGQITLRVYFGAGQTRARDFILTLSDIASGSTGLIVNASPQSDYDGIVVTRGVGAVSALSNAISAYRGAANHNAGLKALELRGTTDGWLDAAMAGT